jgi:hypothetical protein
MKKNSRPDLVGSFSIAGSLVSVVALGYMLVDQLGISAELLFSILAAAVGAIAGIYSWKLAETAKRLVRERRVFLSYSWKDSDSAREIAEALRRAGAKVWLDSEQIQPGERIQSSITRALDSADAFVILLSDPPTSHILYELHQAQQRGIRIIPVLLSPTELPPDIKDVAYIDLRAQPETGIQRLVSAVA